MQGMTNSGGSAAYKASQALAIAQEAKEIARSAESRDEGSTVDFKFGCDAKGVYIVTPDEEEEGAE